MRPFPAVSVAIISIALASGACGTPSTPAPAAAPAVSQNQSGGPANAADGQRGVGQRDGGRPDGGRANGGQFGQGADRVTGAVQTVANGKVTLANGEGFGVTADTRVTKNVPKTAADLKTGQFVAVTAKPQPDGTLLASIVNIFGEAFRNAGAGQRPLGDGALMTNATIDKVDGNSFTVHFPGGDASVKLAPDGRVGLIDTMGVSDLPLGATISALVRDGVALNVSVQ